jgi:hypothetical protein
MAIGNGSNHDVDYEVQPSTPNITTPALLSAVLTGGGAAATALGCLLDVGDPELTVLGLFMLVAALVADVYIYNAASPGAAAFVPTAVAKGTIKAGDPPVPHPFLAGTWVVFRDAKAPGKPILAVSPPIFNEDADVTLRGCFDSAAVRDIAPEPDPRHIEVNPVEASSLT